MSRKANPTLIGAFLVGALAIAIAGTAVLASGSWFEQHPQFISYFPESVNGLENGAPVKFQGVPVGRVTGINIRIDQRDESFQVPVAYEIDLKQLTTPAGTYVNLEDTTVLRQQIAKGLRAQLQMESFVTGVLYVELSYRRDSTPPRLETSATPWPEIPTTPSLMTAIGGGAGSILEKVVGILERVNGMLAELDMREINAAVTQSTKAMQELLASPELRQTLKQMPATTAQLQRTMAETERLAARVTAAVDPLQNNVNGVSTEATATLKALQRTLDETHALLSTDTGPGYALSGALTSLREAADALTRLINSLEQNPDMLIRGRKPPGDK